MLNFIYVAPDVFKELVDTDPAPWFCPTCGYGENVCTCDDSDINSSGNNSDDSDDDD